MLALDRLIKKITISKSYNKKILNPNKKSKNKTEKLKLDITYKFSRLDARDSYNFII